MSDAAAQNITLPAIVDLDALDHVREQLLDAIGHGPVAIDAAKVERIATNALIMLLSGAETARRLGGTLTLEEPSEVMQAAIARLGLDGQFAAIVKG